MKKLRVPCVLFCSAAVQNTKGNDSKPEPVVVRRTDLPVYAEEVEMTEKRNTEENSTFMMEVVKSFRIEACKVAQATKSVRDRCSRFLDTGIAHSYASYENATEFLRDDKNLLPRIGAIGGGSLVGYIFGLRRGFFKRFLYVSLGGTSVAAVCYPKECSEYLEYSTRLSKRYFVIGYHFVNGVTKDFVGLELPALPQKIQEPMNKTTKADE